VTAILVQLADAVAEIMLAGAGVYAAQRMLRGYAAERRAERGPAEDRAGLLADAKTHYARAAFQNPVVLSAVLAGSAIKLAVAVGKLLQTG
jgi:hypothetical protein